MAKSKLPKKKETREEFDERVKNSILKPQDDDSGTNPGLPPPPPGSDQGPEPGTAHRVGMQQRLLPCILTPEELHDRSIKLAEINGRIAAERVHQAEIKRDLKNEMGALEKEWTNLSNTVLTGLEERTVDVAIEMLGDGETVEEIRQDTNERLGPPRPATDFEKQGRMFPDDGDMGFGNGEED
ncbi:MAG: hypothetical protein PHI12_07540 [Dehalococcoidales bacterium]|nr:hypothetical protein [Dehalococcoidales bacterium]